MAKSKYFRAVLTTPGKIGYVGLGATKKAAESKARALAKKRSDVVNGEMTCDQMTGPKPRTVK